jgi:hypothetical protein
VAQLIHSLNFNKKLYFIVFLLIVLAITFFTQKLLLTSSIIAEAFGSQLGNDRLDSLIEAQEKWGWITYVLLPFIYLLKFSLVAFCLYIGTLLVSNKVKFENIFHVVLLAEVVFLIPSILKLYWFLFVQPYYTIEDLQYFSPISLLSFVGYENVAKWSIYPLQLINVFELINWLLLAYGLHLVIKKPFKESLGVVTASYGTGLVLWVVFITFLTVSIGV